MMSESSNPDAVSGASSPRSQAAKSSPKQQALMKCGLTSRCSNRSVSTVIASCIPVTTLLLNRELAALVIPLDARQERHAEQVLAQRLIGQHEAGDVAHDEPTDLDHAEPDRRGRDDAVRGAGLDRIVAPSRMDAEPRGIAL